MAHYDLQKKMVLKAITNLKKRHKGNTKYRVYPQDVVAELNGANNFPYFKEFYHGVHCTKQEVIEIMTEAGLL